MVLLLPHIFGLNSVHTHKTINSKNIYLFTTRTQLFTDHTGFHLSMDRIETLSETSSQDS